MLSTNDYGGAARAALRLTEAFRKQDILADMFVKYKKTNLDYIKHITGPEIDNLLIENIAQKYFYSNIYKGNTMLSLMYPSLKFDFIKLLTTYDVVNLHWIATFISLEAIAALDSVNKPLVWTLHDQNPMTGACHYTHGCDKYLLNCDNCPQMKNNRLNLTQTLLTAKVKYMPRNLVVVTPSKWLAECAKKSAVFKDNRVEVIPNSVELSVFKSYEKSKAKSMFNFSKDTRIILFGAENHGERRKGFVELLKAMKLLKQKTKVQKLIADNKIAILAFGNESDDIKKLDIPYTALGYVKDDAKLALAYSAADVVALPSLEDNLPNIILESFSCKTPVVAFDCGGMPDFIVNDKTGYIVPINNTDMFADALVNVLLGESLGENCRFYAERYFSQSRQAVKYINLFDDLLKTKNIYSYNRQEIKTMFPEVGKVLADLLCESGVNCQERINKLQESNNSLQESNNRLINDNEVLQNRFDNVVVEKNYVVDERNSLQNKLNDILKSRSWRITAFMRLGGSWLKKFMQ